MALLFRFAIVLTLLVSSQLAAREDSVSTRPKAELSSVTLRVEGMATPNCPVLVRRAVIAVDGVTSVHASLKERTATVEYDPARTSVDAIKEIIRDRVGFDSEVVD